MQLIQRTSLRDETANLLRKWILEGRLAAGESLRETKLCELLGVSRTPLREALLGLERDGFVESSVNKGFKVSRVDVNMIVELYQIVGNLEALALRLSGSTLLKNVNELKKINEQIKRAIQPPEELYELDLRFHEMLWKSCPNNRLVEMLSMLKLHIARFDGAGERGVADISNSVNQHSQIIDAIEREDFTEAAAEDEAHWKFGTNTVIKWIEKNKVS